MSVRTDNTSSSTQPPPPKRPGSKNDAEPRRRDDLLGLMGQSKWSRALAWVALVLAIIFPFPFWW